MFNPKLSKINQIRIRTLSKQSQKVKSLQKMRVYTKSKNKFQIQKNENKEPILSQNTKNYQQIYENQKQTYENQSVLAFKRQKQIKLATYPSYPFNSKQKEKRLSLYRVEQKKQKQNQEDQNQVNKQLKQDSKLKDLNFKEQINLQFENYNFSQKSHFLLQNKNKNKISPKIFIKQERFKYFTISNILNFKISPTFNKQYTDSQTQTFFSTTEDQMNREYTPFRLLKFQSIESVQNYISKIGEKERTQMNSRAQELNEYINDGPKEEIQTKIYKLVQNLEKKQNKFEFQIQKIIQDQQMKEYNIDLAICKCKDSLKPTIQSIKSLINIFRSKFKTEKEPVFYRITKRIQKLLFHILKETNTTMEKVNAFKSISSPWIQMANSFNSWHYENEQYKRLIQNCVNRILVLPITSYEMFGNNETQFYQDMKNANIDSQQKQKQKFIRMFQNKCEDCQLTKDKIMTIQKQNNVLKPIIKVLNQLVKNLKSSFFKHELKMSSISQDYQKQEECE